MVPYIKFKRVYLLQACGKFINNNAVTKHANSSSKSPELLARYCDLLLKKSSKNPEEAELEDTLGQVVRASSAFYCVLPFGHVAKVGFDKLKHSLALILSQNCKKNKKEFGSSMHREVVYWKLA